MKKNLFLCLAPLAVLVTGCPRNQYIVELAPRGQVIERSLIFYRENGTDTNGTPVYEPFPPDELSAITRLYPAGRTKQQGHRHAATGEFSGAMPDDVGGAGKWTNFTTTLGSAAIYAERFRGNDDLAATSGRRLEAADQLADLVVGWSRAELGRELRYEDLRRFLDVDFRRDLKNLGLYTWLGEIASTYKDKAGEEFVVRFGQYLVERGYLKIGDLPAVFTMAAEDDQRAMMRLIQRLVAEKLGVPESQPVPSSLAFLADPEATLKSWEEFLATTEFYQAKIKQWEKEKELKPGQPKPKPKPSEVAGELVANLIQFRLFGTDDHLVVRLSLPSPPVHTNGQWDEARKQVLWEADLESREGRVRLPVFCYASWSQAAESFQKEHFGRVLLGGEDLLQYCLWRAGLNQKLAQEWETLLASLRPGNELAGKLETFRFSGEPLKPGADEEKQAASPSDFPRQLLKSALQKKAQADGK